MRTLILSQWIAGAMFLSIPFAVSAQDKEIKALASTVAESLQKTSKKTVAVVDFTDLQGNVTELGRYLAEEVSVALAGTGTGIEVVDRTHLRALLQENKLASSGIIDPTTARKLGQIAGVEILMTGTIVPFGDSVKFSVKALDTTTARIVSASSAEIAKTRAIEELLNRGVASQQPGSGRNPGDRAQAEQTALTTDARQFRFTLKACSLAGRSVTCSLTVRNEDNDDRILRIYTHIGKSTSKSRIIDNEGRETDLESIQFGGKNGGQSTLVSGVPTNLQLLFEPVDQDLSSIALFELWCELVDPDSYKGQDFSVQLRRVPIASHGDFEDRRPAPKR